MVWQCMKNLYLTSQDVIFLKFIYLFIYLLTYLCNNYIFIYILFMQQIIIYLFVYLFIQPNVFIYLFMLILYDLFTTTHSYGMLWEHLSFFFLPTFIMAWLGSL